MTTTPILSEQSQPSFRTSNYVGETLERLEGLKKDGIPTAGESITTEKNCEKVYRELVPSPGKIVVQVSFEGMPCPPRKLQLNSLLLAIL